MKLKSIGRAALATGMSLAIGLGATACSRDYVAAYVYSTSAGGATVSAFEVDYQTGALTQISGSPFGGSGVIGRNPVTLVAAPSGKFLYVVSHDDSSVTEFAIGTDGKLYGQHTYNTVGGTFPTAAAIDSTGKFLYVTFTLQTGFTTASPGNGGVDVFPINADNTLGQATAVPVGNSPVSVAVSAPAPTTGNVYVYVLDQEASPNATVIGFIQNPTTGALTLASGSTYNATLKTYQGYHAGVTPSSVVIEPTARYVYVSDKTSNEILGYQISNSSGSTTNGNLTALNTSPYATGSFPVNLAVDPRGKYLFSANYNSSTVGSYAINAADGSLSGVAGTAAASVATNPTCVTIEPALGIYLYTSNSLDGSISGEQLNPNTGALTAIANTPFPASTLPSCVTAVANGSHTNSIVNP